MHLPNHTPCFLSSLPKSPFLLLVMWLVSDAFANSPTDCVLFSKRDCVINQFQDQVPVFSCDWLTTNSVVQAASCSDVLRQPPHPTTMILTSSLLPFANWFNSFSRSTFWKFLFVTSTLCLILFWLLFRHALQVCLLSLIYRQSLTGHCCQVVAVSHATVSKVWSLSACRALKNRTHQLICHSGGSIVSLFCVHEVEPPGGFSHQ